MTVLVGRGQELSLLQQHLASACDGHGSAILVSGEPGIGKTRLVEEFRTQAESVGVSVLYGTAISGDIHPFHLFSKILASVDATLNFEMNEHASFAEIFAVDENGTLVGKSSSDKAGLDAETFAGTLSAVQSFARDSFGHGSEKVGLGRIEYGTLKIIMEHGTRIFLAAVFKGTEHPDMKKSLRIALGRIDAASTVDSVVKEEIERLAEARFLVRRDLDGVKLRNERLKMADRALECVAVLSKKRQLLIILDDLHWADESSLFVFNYLARNLNGLRVLLLGTCRPNESQALERMISEGAAEKINLKKLDSDAVAGIIERRYPSNDFTREFVDSMTKRCGGNPLFITEFLKHMESEGAFAERNGRCMMVHEDYAVPDSIGDLVRARLAKLDSEELACAEYASCIGVEFPSWAVASVHAVSKPDESLGKLRALGIVTSKGESMEFTHALFHTAVYEGIAPRWKTAHHRSIGESYEKKYKNRLDEASYELARHFLTGGPPEKAFIYSAMAGSKAEGAYAAEQALTHYADALHLVESAKFSGEENIQRFDIVERMGQLLTLLGRYDESAAIFRRGLDLASDAEVKSRLHRHIAASLEKPGKLDEAMDELAKAVALHSGTESTELGMVVSAMGKIHEGRGDYPTALAEEKRALAILEKYGAPLKEIGTVHRRIGSSLHGLSRYDDAIATYRIALDIARKQGDEFNIGGLLGDMAIVYAVKGDYQKALEHIRESTAIKERIGDIRSAGIMYNNLGVIQSDMGDIAGAERSYGRYLEISRRIGDRWDEATALGNLATILMKQNRIDEAIAMHERAEEMFSWIGDKQSQAYMRLELSECWLLKPDVAKADENATKGAELSRDMGSREYDGLFARVRGQICSAKRDWKGAAESFESSISILTETGNARALPEAFNQYGLMLSAKGEKEGAKTMFLKAKELYLLMGVDAGVKEMDGRLSDLK